MSTKFMRALGVVAAALVALAAWFAYARLLPAADVMPQPAPSQKPGAPLVIGLSVGGYRESRWQKEVDIMTAEAKRLGATMVTMGADGDPALQEQQAKELMDQGVKVLVVVANDGEKAAAIVEEAHKRGVKVIAYDRLIRNADLDYYISFDNIKVGEVQAFGVLEAVGGKGNFAYIGGSPTDNNASLVRTGSFNILQPKIDSGDVRIVLDKQVPDWNADIAYQTLADFLKKGGKVDAVVVANDGMAGGVIKALREHGLAGKVPVSGQDAELFASRSLVSGDQTLTVYKPLRKLAEEAVRMAISVATAQPPSTNATVNNGRVYVPSRLLNVVMVTKKNLDDTVILDGFHSREDVYGAAQ